MLRQVDISNAKAFINTQSERQATIIELAIGHDRGTARWVSGQQVITLFIIEPVFLSTIGIAALVIIPFIFRSLWRQSGDYAPEDGVVPRGLRVDLNIAEQM